ncbi:MAG: hypothetical protein LW875_08640 [Proteobacteria bacterium]|jgi:hypothetical protein|nr:hypothetical protein [Pseudomonadota bacterium]
MGLGDKVNQMAGNVQQGVKTTSISLALWMLKLATAFMVGLTVALIGQEMMKFGTISFVFMMIVVGGAILKLMSSWSIGSVVIFDLFLILVALLLRMYILVAP